MLQRIINLRRWAQTQGRVYGGWIEMQGPSSRSSDVRQFVLKQASDGADGAEAAAVRRRKPNPVKGRSESGGEGVLQ